MGGAHPSKDIVGEYGGQLRDKCVALGVTGSVAAYRAVDVARWLMRRGARVRVVLTREATRLVTPTLFHWATGEEPIVDLTGEVEHIVIARECDAMLVAPATLSSLSKMAWGVVDNPVVLTAVSVRGMGKPVAVFPAMHGNMMDTVDYREASAALARKGYIVIHPLRVGGLAKFHDPRLVARIAAAITLRGRDMEGVSVLVTAGATREWIDPVRFISNPSTGRMGVEVALEAYARGASVTLLHGHVEVDIPPILEQIPVETTEDMAREMSRLTSETRYDVIVAAAAPADYRPSRTFREKVPSGGRLELSLEPTPKVLASIAQKPKVLVAFAAETVATIEELERRARGKMERYGADVIVGNAVGVGTGFASERNSGVILTRTGKSKRFDRVLKEDLAREIMDVVADLMGEGGRRGR